MARGGASIQPGFIYHLISRFVAKEWFVESAVERRVYLSLLGLALTQTDWRCFCYAVMSSHIHIGVVAGTTKLVEWMRPMHTTFAQWLNLRRERIGGVFVRGPNVITVEPEHAGRLINYVHCNPVRAGVVANAHDCDWTSYRAYAGAAHVPGWLDVDCGLGLAGLTSRAGFEAWSGSVQTSRDEAEQLGLLPRAKAGRPPVDLGEAPKMRNPPRAGRRVSFVAGERFEGLSKRIDLRFGIWAALE